MFDGLESAFDIGMFLKLDDVGSAVDFGKNSLRTIPRNATCKEPSISYQNLTRYALSTSQARPQSCVLTPASRTICNAHTKCSRILQRLMKANDCRTSDAKTLDSIEHNNAQLLRYLRTVDITLVAEAEKGLAEDQLHLRLCRDSAEPGSRWD